MWLSVSMKKQHPCPPLARTHPCCFSKFLPTKPAPGTHPLPAALPDPGTCSACDVCSYRIVRARPLRPHLGDIGKDASPCTRPSGPQLQGLLGGYLLAMMLPVMPRGLASEKRRSVDGGARAGVALLVSLSWLGLYLCFCCPRSPSAPPLDQLLTWPTQRDLYPKSPLSSTLFLLPPTRNVLLPNSLACTVSHPKAQRLLLHYYF